MAGTALRRNRVEVAWGAFCLANLAAMALSPTWETIPFHFIWTSLTILYGFRVWRPGSTLAVLLAICMSTGSLILLDAENGDQAWGELFEVPLMSMMFLAMVWHARRHQVATDTVASQARERAVLLERQEQFLHDVSHELRTPLTIARGHIDALARANGATPPEAAVALDELDRLGRLIEQLLVLAKAGNAVPVTTTVDLDDLLENVVMRWAEVAPRVWRVGDLPHARLDADPDALRIALDALIENAVKHTTTVDEIEVRARLEGDVVVIEVADGGAGIAEDALEGVFERFARAEPAGRDPGHGVGLGLAIVDAIMKSHGGSCTVQSTASGSTFALSLPGAKQTTPSDLNGDGPYAVAPVSLAGMPGNGA
ncbi:MAG: two-component system, OmpR family, sensor kinase [Actinomycetota bacterium]|nr:two-component system, OmpR family, sensor kinase [Actinomycetota bacterium]